MFGRHICTSEQEKSDVGVENGEADIVAADLRPSAAVRQPYLLLQQVFAAVLTLKNGIAAPPGRFISTTASAIVVNGKSCNVLECERSLLGQNVVPAAVLPFRPGILYRVSCKRKDPSKCRAVHKQL